jgi:hypothetical protein
MLTAWRTRRESKEVDFTGPWMSGVVFESKYTDASWKRETRTLRALTDRRVILTRGVLDLGGDVCAVPVSVASVAAGGSSTDRGGVGGGRVTMCLAVLCMVVWLPRSDP